MPAEHIVVPREVAEAVERYVARELADQRKYENRSPLDEAGVYELHVLGAMIYAAGFNDGDRVAEVRARGREAREASRESGAST